MKRLSAIVFWFFAFSCIANAIAGLVNFFSGEIDRATFHLLVLFVSCWFMEHAE